MSIYDIKFEKTNGEQISLEKNKVTLIVNTATKCGLAPQFIELEELYQTYKDKDFTIIGFPSNQFMNQEPVDNKSMEEVCKLNFGVTFKMMKKIDVNGKDEHPLFKYLKDHSKSFFKKDIKWNFTKFLVDKNGKVVKRYSPTVKPLSMKKDIEKLLR